MRTTRWAVVAAFAVAGIAGVARADDGADEGLPLPVIRPRPQAATSPWFDLLRPSSSPPTTPSSACTPRHGFSFYLDGTDGPATKDASGGFFGFLFSDIATIVSEVEAAAQAEAQREAAAAAAAKAAAEAAARAEAQKALDARVNQAISNAANAWRPDGIVNSNTGDHSWDMYCLALASTAWETALGHPVADFDKSCAYQSYLAFKADGLVHDFTGANPPRGAVVFWPAGSSGYGHVAISNGDGTVVSNFNRQAEPTGINPAAPMSDFGQPIGWVDPADLK